jgi:hypothetical protein
MKRIGLVGYGCPDAGPAISSAAQAVNSFLAVFVRFSRPSTGDGSCDHGRTHRLREHFSNNYTSFVARRSQRAATR